MLARNTYNANSATACRSCGATERPARTPAIAPSSSAATGVERDPRRLRARGLSATDRRRARSVRSAAGGDRASLPASRERRLRPGQGRRRSGVTRSRLAMPSYGDRRARHRATRPSRFWDETLGAVQVHTPDDSFDLMVNRWLSYQTLSCRVWARSGFYQSGGAFGFRDQLAGRAGAALLRGRTSPRAPDPRGARQFVEGDVQHWWHPPSRPRHPHAVSPTTSSGCRMRSRHYVVSDTGDAAVLDEVVPFLEAPLAAPDEHEVYDLPSRLRARRPRSSSIACAPSTHAMTLRRARPAADGHRRLERRHEPRRRRGPRRERLAGLVPRASC